MSDFMFFQMNLSVINEIVTFAEGCDMLCVMLNTFSLSDLGIYGRGLPELTSQ